MSVLSCLSDESDLSDVPDYLETDYRLDPEGAEDRSPTSDVLSDASSEDEFVIAPTRKRKSPLFIESDRSHLIGIRNSLQSQKHGTLVRDAPLSSVEMLPNEIIQKIATNVETDTDLCSLGRSSPSFLNRLDAADSEVWRKRFLARYDHPKLDTSLDYRTAYKLRRLVLKNFIPFTDGMNRRAYIQLEVLRDMVLETYYSPNHWAAGPTVSRNLKAFESPATSPWIVTFLSSSFPACTDKKRWGEPDAFFETMQLVLSHLVLSPKSALSHLAASSRENYDLFRVYNFNQPLTTLYTRLPNDAYRLDTASLLHIRNFWHRHLIDDSHPVGEHTYADMMRDLSKMNKTPEKWDEALKSDIQIPTQWFGHYSCVNPWPKARADLTEMQSCAEDWDHVDPLVLDLVTSDDYSTGFWPPAFSTLPAFDHTIALPLESNDLPTTSEGHPVYIRGTATFIDTKKYKEDTQSASPTSSPITALEQAQEKFLKYHPFTALRVRGVVHDIPLSATVDNPQDVKDKAIPGWKRIVMIMYKPNVSYLINVLEHAAEDYGGVFATQLTNQINTANVWGAGAGSGTGTVAVTNTNSNTTATTTTTTATSNNPTTNAPQNNPPTAAIAASILTPQTRLYDLLTSPTSPFSSLPSNSTTATTTTTVDPITDPTTPISTPDPNPNPYTNRTPTPTPLLPSNHTPKIIHLEDQYSAPHYTTWEPDTLDFAYAYEGAVLPGGKIMMGRWWRCHGLTGLGPGWEVDAFGDGVEEDNDDAGDEVDMSASTVATETGSGSGSEAATATATVDESTSSSEGTSDGTGNGGAGGRRRQQLERGPFVFWC